MISVEDWAEIRRLHRSEGMPIRAIARKLGISRTTMRRAVTSDRPPEYERAPKGSIVDAVGPRIRELLGVWPGMPATVVAERIGWDYGMTKLRDRLRDFGAVMHRWTRPARPCLEHGTRADPRGRVHRCGVRRPDNGCGPLQACGGTWAPFHSASPRSSRTHASAEILTFSR